jgi:hypothetical protein
LGRDLARKRASRDQHGGGLPIECTAHGDGNARTDCVARQVVTERQRTILRRDHVRLDEFVQRRQQRRWCRVEHRGDVIEGEAPAERRRDDGNPARQFRHAIQPALHPVADSIRQTGFDDPDCATVDPHQSLFAQPRQQLDEQVGTAARSCRQLQEGCVGFRQQHIFDDARDGFVFERSEHQSLGAPPFQIVQRGSYLGRCATRPRCEKPTDGHRRQARGQRADRRRRSGVGPLQVVEHDDDGRRGCSIVKKGFDVPQEPIPLLGRLERRTQGIPLEDRRLPFEQRLEQRGELHDRRARIARARADGHALMPCERLHLVEQPALAHAGPSFDDGDGGPPGRDPIQAFGNRPELGIPAPDGRAIDVGLAQDAPRGRAWR